MRGSKLGHPAGYLVLSLALAAAASSCARRYRVEGMVVQVDRARSSMVVSHRAVPGLMPAMVMPFPVTRAAELDALGPGSRVEFTLRGGKARDVRLLQSGSDEFDLTPPPETVKLGNPMPDFTLTDAQGRARSLESFHGRVVLVNFLYTRCPLPEVCPRLAASFASLQRRFRDRIGKDLVLLSITLDPQYDTPEVLARYGNTMRADPDAWLFLTGDTAPVARRFGLIHWPEDGVIVHNSQTAILDRRGRLAAMVEGSSYRLEQLVDLVKDQLEKEQ